MEPWHIAIITTATGGVFALFGGWLGSHLGKVTEHEQWLRNEKMRTYSAFLTALNPFAAQTVLTLLAPPQTEAAQTYDMSRNKAWMELMMVATDEVARLAIILYNETKEISQLRDDIPEKAAEALSKLGHSNTDDPRAKAILSEIGQGAILGHVDKMEASHQLLTDAMRRDLDLTSIFEDLNS